MAPRHEDSSDGGTADRAGIYVVGTLVEASPGKAYEGANGTVVPFQLAVLTGRQVVVVEYRDEGSAAVALNGGNVGQPVRLRVIPRMALDNKGQPIQFWRGAVTA